MMLGDTRRNFLFDTIEELSRLTAVPDVAATLARAMADFGFTALGINGLPLREEGADPIILTESTPPGFRELYIHERFYLTDHICAHARAAPTREPFRYSEAPYDRAHARSHERFLQALQTFGMGHGLVVPIGRPAQIPACVWLAGENPELDDDSILATQMIALFAASKAHALTRDMGYGASPLTPREREVLAWGAQGKSAWEIGKSCALQREPWTSMPRPLRASSALSTKRRRSCSPCCGASLSCDFSQCGGPPLTSPARFRCDAKHTPDLANVIGCVPAGGLMQRRDFITLLGGIAAGSPLAARAQRNLPVIGWLSSGSAEGYVEELAAFRRGLAENGNVEGRNVAVEYRWADGHYDRLRALATDLIDRKVAVIAAGGGVTGYVAKALTTTIPIVFATGGDPVAGGAVASLAHPGGNITGATFLAAELTPKKLELLHEALPGMTMAAALINSGGRDPQGQARTLTQAAQNLGLQLSVLYAGTEQEIESAFDALDRLRPGGLMIGPDPFFTDQIRNFAALSLRHAVPAIYDFRDFAAAGGLLSYGASITDAYRLAGAYTARILKGERPADLPFQQSSKVELVINMKTAKALGITFPLTVLGRADEVIE
jgi:putative ABC transport system substrate-binding protein